MPAITVNDLNNAQLDVNTIASVATSTAATVTDRMGNTKNTLSGMNAAVLASAAAVQGSIGYLPPVTYAAGISLTLAAQTVSYSGQTYAPILSALPFTTSGTFETAKFRLIQGVSGADLAAPSGAGLVGFDWSLIQSAINTVEWATRTATNSVNVLRYIPPSEWPAIFAGTSTLDVTTMVQTAINSVGLAGDIDFPCGLFNISATLTVLGNTRNVNLRGVNGVKSILPGGATINSATILQWTGASSGVMLQLNSVEGCTVEKIAFQTKTTTVGVIQISGVTAIQYINRSSCRFSNIDRCGFYDLGVGVHYFDDALDAASNNNMDGHSITRCIFFGLVEGVRIEQTNVYDTEIFRCSFYGSTAYTKHHVHIVKGHAYLKTCYLGVLKDANSVGGKNGIALYVKNGFLNGSDVYGECHNAPFFVWEASSPVGVTCTFTGCIVLNTTATLPTTYNVLNKTGDAVTVVGGRIAGKVSQFAGTGGSITYFGTFAPDFDTTGEPDRVQYFGGSRSSQTGNIGTMGVGIATVNGSAPTLNLYDTTTSTTCEVKYSGGNFLLNKPGFRNGPKVDFTKGEINLQDNGWTVNLGANGKNSIILSTAVSTTVVSNTSVHYDGAVVMFPKTASAAKLMNSVAAPFISQMADGVSFTIATSDGSIPPANCGFYWVML